MHLLPAAVRHGERIGQSFQPRRSATGAAISAPSRQSRQSMPTHRGPIRIHQLAIADLVPFTDQRRSQLQAKRSAPGGNKDHNLAFPKQLVRMHTIQNWLALARIGQHWIVR
jgi:hypothetical protein